VLERTHHFDKKSASLTNKKFQYTNRVLPMLYFYVSVGLLRMISAQAERKMSGKRKKAAPWMKREATFFVKN